MVIFDEAMLKPTDMCVDCRVRLVAKYKRCVACFNAHHTRLVKRKKQRDQAFETNYRVQAVASYKKLSAKYKGKYYVERNESLDQIKPQPNYFTFNGA